MVDKFSSASQFWSVVTLSQYLTAILAQSAGALEYTDSISAEE